jgi:hypothetical protein
MGNGCINPHFLDLCTNWRWAVSFTLLLLYPRKKRPRYPLDRRLGGPRAGLDDVEKRKFLTLPGLEFTFLGRPARRQSIYRLRYPGSQVSGTDKSKYVPVINYGPFREDVQSVQKRLRGPQNRSIRCKEKNLLNLPKILLRFFGSPARSPIITRIQLLRLPVYHTKCETDW